MGLLGLKPEEIDILAASLMSGRGNAIANIGEGLMGIQASKKRKGAEEIQSLQIQQHRQALEQQRVEMEQANRVRALGPQFMQQAQTLPEGQHGPQTPGGMDWGGYANALSGIDPMKGLQMQSNLAQMRKKDEPEMKILPPGSVIGASRGGQFVPFYTAPERPKDWQNPEYIKAQQSIRAAGRPTTNVAVHGEKAFTTELAKLDAKQLDEWRESAVKAQGGLSRLGEMKRLAEEGTYSGFAATGRAGVANFFNTLGVPFDPSKLANSQEYTKHAKELTLTMLKEGVGATNISNADLAFVNETVPQLETNPRARMNLLNYMERRLGDSVNRFQSADTHARQNGGLSGFNYQAPRAAPQGSQGKQAGGLQRNATATHKAREAIKAGKNREAVIQRLMESGFDPGGL